MVNLKSNFSTYTTFMQSRQYRKHSKMTALAQLASLMVIGYLLLISWRAICEVKDSIKHLGSLVRVNENVTILISETCSRITKDYQVTEDVKNTNDDNSIDDHGFWADETAKSHHVFDQNLSNALMAFFKNENISSLIDLGAGMGHYSKQAMESNIFTSCYDGNPKTVEISDGRCATVDLSKAIHFYQYDWVMSLEVGEHIPNEYEDIFINNLDRVCRKGAIVSWAVENQGGHGHVNERANSYIISKFEKLGYKQDINAQKILRDAAEMYWFKNTIMVFRK